MQVSTDPGSLPTDPCTRVSAIKRLLEEGRLNSQTLCTTCIVEKVRIDREPHAHGHDSVLYFYWVKCVTGKIYNDRPPDRLEVMQIQTRTSCPKGSPIETTTNRLYERPTLNTANRFDFRYCHVKIPGYHYTVTTFLNR